jgi:hypothetical protein
LSANHLTPFFFVTGFGFGAYSEKLFAGTRQRFSGFSQPRQWGDGPLNAAAESATVDAGPPLITFRVGSLG